MEIVKEVLVAPGIFVPPVCHCKVGTGRPETDALKVALLVCTTVWLAGPVIPGATVPDETVRVMAFVTIPALLLAISE